MLALQTELLDAFNKKENSQSNPLASTEDDRIGFRAASFTWNEEAETTLSHRRRFRLVIEDEILFKRGQINLIAGQTGSGKTSMLMALLGEMHYTPLNSSSFFSLPRDKGVAYHAQDSWILNETIKVGALNTLDSRV
jgi:ABC-type multidrug transport system fused ATPase/permease subunit